MTTTASAPASLPDRQDDRPARWPLVGAVLLLAAGIALRFIQTSPLWLDEAQTVAIARHSLGGVFSALRIDGSPPVFYLLLHFWIEAFGASTFAVRALAGVLSVACLPVGLLAARRLGLPRDLAWTVTLLLASSPFAIAYATQARMYSLVLLLALLAVVAYERVWRAGSPWPVAGAALVTAALLLTHYWSLFFYAVAGAFVLVRVCRGSRPARRVLVALVLAAVPFVPWLPTFLFQMQHTGAPWGTPPGIDTVLLLPLSWSGAGLTGKLLAGAIYLLVPLALWGRVDHGVRFGPPVRRLPLILAGLAGGGIVLASAVGAIIGSAYAVRYSTIALAPVVLLMAFGFAVLPERWRPAAVGVVCILGVLSAVGEPTQARTQAGLVAERMHPAPGDVVAFCPDQLGPAVHRLAPDAGRQVVYPDLASPNMVNWVDYKERIKQSSPAEFVRRLLALAGPQHAIYLVFATDYQLYANKCSKVASRLGIARGFPRTLVNEKTTLIEHEALVVFPPRS